MAEIPPIRGADFKRPKTKKWYKKRLARQRRREAKQNPEKAGTSNRHGIGGYYD